MPPLVLVMLGGAIGSGARHLTGRAALALWGPAFPWGTVIVNLLGGFAMGALVAWLSARSGSEATRYLLGVGVLGGFTTFSAFSLDAVVLWQKGQGGMAALYVAASVLLSIAALGAGLAVGHSA